MLPKTVSVREAKAHLSKLFAQVASGQHFIIANRGRPVAQLIPLEQAKPQRRPGVLKGRIRIAQDFDAPLPAEVVREFGGGGSTRKSGLKRLSDMNYRGAEAKQLKGAVEVVARAKEKPSGLSPAPRVRGKKTLSDLVIEDRR